MRIRRHEWLERISVVGIAENQAREIAEKLTSGWKLVSSAPYEPSLGYYSAVFERPLSLSARSRATGILGRGAS